MSLNVLGATLKELSDAMDCAFETLELEEPIKKYKKSWTSRLPHLDYSYLS
jgi:hypothetical protein